MARTKKTAAKSADPVIVRSLDMPSLENRVYNMDGAKIRNYDLFSLEKRIYDLEQGGTPGPTPPTPATPIVHWDFTSDTNPLVDKVAGYTAELYDTPTVNGDGVHIATDSQCIFLPIALMMLDATYEITFGTVSLASSGNARVFVTRPISYTGSSENPTCGLYYQAGEVNKWGTYDTTNNWQLSDEGNKDIISNSTLKIYVDITGKWHIYINGTLMFEPVNPIPIQQTKFAIGCPITSCDDMYVKDLKIYRGEH